MHSSAKKSFAHLYTPYSIDEDVFENAKIKFRIYKTHATHELDPAEYQVVNYDKTYLCFDEPLNYTQCRSVILSHPEQNLLSFSPPRSITSDAFFKKYSSLNDETIQMSSKEPFYIFFMTHVLGLGKLRLKVRLVAIIFCTEFRIIKIAIRQSACIICF